jgi:hypothetical protein
MLLDPREFLDIAEGRYGSLLLGLLAAQSIPLLTGSLVLFPRDLFSERFHAVDLAGHNRVDTIQAVPITHAGHADRLGVLGLLPLSLQSRLLGDVAPRRVYRRPDRLDALLVGRG